MEISFRETAPRTLVRRLRETFRVSRRPAAAGSFLGDARPLQMRSEKEAPNASQAGDMESALAMRLMVDNLGSCKQSTPLPSHLMIMISLTLSTCAKSRRDILIRVRAKYMRSAGVFVGFLFMVSLHHIIAAIKGSPDPSCLSTWSESQSAENRGSWSIKA